MEERDIKLIEQYAESDPELKELWDEHILFEKKLAMYKEKVYLTPDEQQTVKMLKKQKLEGKTRLANLLDKYKK